MSILRFIGSNFDQNLRILNEVEAVAEEAGATPAQVALAWLLAQDDDIAPMPGTKRVSRLEENAAADTIALTAGQLARTARGRPPSSLIVSNPIIAFTMMRDDLIGGALRTRRETARRGRRRKRVHRGVRPAVLLVAAANPSLLPTARQLDRKLGALINGATGVANPSATSPSTKPRLETTMHNHTLEPAARQFADATAQPPFLYELGPDAARKVLDDLQAAPIAKPDVDETWITVPAEVGDVAVRIVKPLGATGPLPTVLYVHGGGWILGNAGTHDRLVRELAVGTNAAVVFVEYDRSPEAQYPVAIEQAYATARWITESGHAHGLDASRLAVAGDSVGGNMTAVLAILAKQRGDVTFVHQSMYYPVTDAAQDTDSYVEFADGPFLTAKAMAWFWDAYCPDEARRSEITASPLRASLDDLAGLPEAFLIVDENDVLRDEGEAYARKLTEAGVRTTSVRFNGAIHDLLMLNPLRDTAATTAALDQAIHVLRKALGSNQPTAQ